MKSYVITGLAGIVSVSIAGCSGKSAGNNKRPNIIFILADDLGYNDPGCYGQKIIETPNIDALANNGIRFTQYYCGSPVSAPSRCVLLTGLHTGHSFIRGNHEWPERGDVWDYYKMEEDPRLEGQYPVPANTLTFSKVLQSEGYKTACMGKWGLVLLLPVGFQTNRDSTRDGNLKIRLFNLDSDITEETDLSDKYPAIVKQIEEIMVRAHTHPEVGSFNLFAIK